MSAVVDDCIYSASFAEGQTFLLIQGHYITKIKIYMGATAMCELETIRKPGSFVNW